MKLGKLDLLSLAPSLMPNRGRGQQNRAAAIGRMLIFLLVPQWVWVVGALIFVLGAVLAVVVLAVDSSTSATSADLGYQCDSAIGPDPGVTGTAVPAGAGDDSVSPSDIPTTNPYAQLTIAPGEADISDWDRACVNEMRVAPYQLPPLLTADTGPGVACARELALAQVGGRSPGNDAAAWSASLIYQASAASAAGRCDVPAGPPTGDAASPPALAIPPDAVAASNPCARSGSAAASQAAVVLPETVAAQGACGQRVDPTAVSAGDLVFWNYRNYAPTCVGIALGPGEVVTSDPVSGKVIRQPMPTGSGVRAKRVLRGGL